jgi:8-amino-7-oxononanoate synthase
VNRPTGLKAAISAILAERQSNDLLRTRRIVESVDATHLRIDGRILVNFSSNDYLGLAHHPKLVQFFRDMGSNAPAGASASSLISGYSTIHASAESAVAAWKKTESAILLPSGYQANHAAVQTFAALAPDGKPNGVRFLLDRLVHASLIDAVRGSGMPLRVFPHGNLEKLRKLLAAAEPNQLQVVVTESIFSMDGDAADLAALAELKSELGFALLLDEAHASGVYGSSGAGLAAEQGLTDLADCTVVTFSKALGLMGGAICGNEDFCQAVVNFGRAYIYSTSILPSLAGAIDTGIQILRDEPDRQLRLRSVCKMVREKISEMGWKLPPGDSPIIPILLKSEREAQEDSQKLLDRGCFVHAIRPPTVPRGTSRLRITLSSEHSEADINGLLDVLKVLRQA